MLAKRIIPCLDIKDGRVVKGINFNSLRDSGDPVDLAKYYAKAGADELVLLDISASLENRSTMIEIVEKVAEVINIPFTVGGGISTFEDAKNLLLSGADKVSLNSSAIKKPYLISEISNQFGSQSVVVAIDIKKVDKEWMVISHGGTKPTGLLALDWAKKVEKCGAGEILLTSMDNDGVKDGFAIEITDRVSSSVNIPVIASGGAGRMNHFSSLFLKSSSDAALAASVFHYNDISIYQLKKYLSSKRIDVRLRGEDNNG